MGTEVVVLPAPTIGRGIGFWHGGDHLSVEEFISEPTVKRYGKTGLSR